VDDSRSSGSRRAGKSREAFRTISEVAELLDLPQHVLRFWESKFSQIKPLKRGGNRRYYRPDDVTLLTAIKKLLHSDGYTIRGVQKLFKAQGVRSTILLALDDEAPTGISVGDGAEPDLNVHSESTANLAAARDGSTADNTTDNGDTLMGLRPILERLRAIRAQLD